MITKQEIIDPKFESLEPDFRKAIEKCMTEYAQPAVEVLKKIEGALTGIGDYVTEDILKITTEALKQYNQ